MSFRAVLKFVLFFCVALMPVVTNAQQTGATVHGVVADPQSAVIPDATVTLTPVSGKALITRSQSDGSYVLQGVPAETYSMTVTMSGFASYVKLGVKVATGQNLALDAKMAIQEQQQEVNVNAQGAQVSVDSDSNASSTIIKGKDLDALSDDPDELSSELTALAGPAAGPNGGQIYVDGFTGGQLPPKSSIREIRINQNPFSAQYDRVGFGRVEVFTKPGSDKFHGQFQMQGIDSALNTGNPLLNAFNTPGQPEQTLPPYHTIFVLGNMTGPLSKIASFTLSGSHRAIEDNSLVSATVPTGLSTLTSTFDCPTGQVSCNYSIANPAPQSRTDISPRFDLQLGEKNTLVSRFEYEVNDQNNLGVGALNLPSTGYNSSASEVTAQISDTQIVSPRIINETRFEYQRDFTTETALSTAPTIMVQGNFTGGGANTGSESDHQIHFEAQNYTSIQLTKNFIRFGGRLRSTRDANSTTSGTNGEFTYDCLLNSLCNDSTSSYENNQASQFTLTQIAHPVLTTLVDLGMYLEDDWKPVQNLSVSYGFRYETQNHLADHHDIAPRVSARYGVGKSKSNPKTVLNGGFGLFYDRFQLANVLTTIQENGINQVQTQITNPGPGCTPESFATNPSACTGTTTGGNKTYSASPNLRSPYAIQFAAGVDQQLFRGATVSVTYLRSNGVHQFYSENVNAPINGIYPTPPVNDASPLVQYQYQSGGVYHQNQLIVSGREQKGIASLFGYFVLNDAKADTSSITSFPSIPYDIGADYGRSTFDIRYRLFVGGSFSFPHSISVAPIVILSAGTPYNITLGRDLNGDGVYNDRPAFGAPNGIAPGTAGSNTIRGCGSFVTPTAGQAPIPINLCTGPTEFVTNLRITKTFGFGHLTDAAAARQASRNGNNGGPGGGGGGNLSRGGPGGPGGGGGRGGPGGGFTGTNTGHRYNLSFGVQALNVFNNVDLSTPNGTLTSQQFGRSTQLAGNPFTSSDAARRISLQTSFTF